MHPFADMYGRRNGAGYRYIHSTVDFHLYKLHFACHRLLRNSFTSNVFLHNDTAIRHHCGCCPHHPSPHLRLGQDGYCRIRHLSRIQTGPPPFNRRHRQDSSRCWPRRHGCFRIYTVCGMFGRSRQDLASKGAWGIVGSERQYSARARNEGTGN